MEQRITMSLKYQSLDKVQLVDSIFKIVFIHFLLETLHYILEMVLESIESICAQIKHRISWLLPILDPCAVCTQSKITHNALFMIWCMHPREYWPQFLEGY